MHLQSNLHSPVFDIYRCHLHSLSANRIQQNHHRLKCRIPNDYGRVRARLRCKHPSNTCCTSVDPSALTLEPTRRASAYSHSAVARNASPKLSTLHGSTKRREQDNRCTCVNGATAILYTFRTRYACTIVQPARTTAPGTPHAASRHTHRSAPNGSSTARHRGARVPASWQKNCVKGNTRPGLRMEAARASDPSPFGEFS